MKQFTKITILSVALIFGGIFAHFASAQSVQNQENRVLIYDGASDPRNFSNKLFILLPPKYKESNESDEIESARKQILAKSSQIKNSGLEIMKTIESAKTSINCKQFRQNKIVVNATNGTFTKPNTKQNAYLYQLYFCDDDQQPKEEYSDTIGGIAVFENEKIVANYVYAGFKFSGLKALPDINQNGLSELILAREYNDIDLVELTDNKINSFGSFREVHNFNGGLDGMPYFYNSKKIYAVPGKQPEFFEESYSQKGSDKVIISEPLQKVSLNSPGDWSSFFRSVK